MSVLFTGEELPAAGEVISALVLDSNVVIMAGNHREHSFRIENAINVRESSQVYTVRYDPYNRQHPSILNITELASIVSKQLIHARAFMSGTLELSFSNNTVITVQPLDHYEAWMYTYGNFILACPPGGFET
jgi:hypothetical protein